MQVLTEEFFQTAQLVHDAFEQKRRQAAKVAQQLHLVLRLITPADPQ